jgi:5-methyltetrahydropteroyltriglutamate--homocysteine methyltransferase
MPPYPRYTTTVVGAHSVPRWYEALDRLVAVGQLAEGDLADAQLRASQAAILEQEIAGIDVVTGGELHRRRHNRHSPPNAMLNHFWERIPSFQGETRPKPITQYDPNVFHPAAICRGPIPDTVNLGLVEEFKTVSSFARKPVKVTMTGRRRPLCPLVDRKQQRDLSSLWIRRGSKCSYAPAACRR